MIIIGKNEEESVLIPVGTVKSSSETRTLTLENLLTKKIITLEVTDTGSDKLYQLMLNSVDIPSGEYKYTIEGNTGLLRVTEETEEGIQYNLDIEYKTYGN